VIALDFPSQQRACACAKDGAWSTITMAVDCAAKKGTCSGPDN